MPYQDACIHFNDENFQLYARLKMKPLKYVLRGSGLPVQGRGLCKIYWAPPHSMHFKMAGVFKWREEGAFKPSVNKSAYMANTGWAYVDTGCGFSQYVSWSQCQWSAGRKWQPIPKVECVNHKEEKPNPQSQGVGNAKYKIPCEKALIRIAKELQMPNGEESSEDEGTPPKRQKTSEADMQFIQNLPKDHIDSTERVKRLAGPCWFRRAKELQTRNGEESREDEANDQRLLGLGNIDDGVAAMLPTKRQWASEADMKFIGDLRNGRTRHVLVNLEEISFFVGGPRGLGLCFERQFIKPLSPSPYIHSHRFCIHGWSIA